MSALYSFLLSTTIPTRFLQTVVMVCVLSGCGASNTATRVGEQLMLAVRGFPDAKVTREYVDELPYASQMVKIGRGPKSLMVLAEVNGDRLTWVGADKTTVITEHGRIIQTAGLPENLSRVKWREDAGHIVLAALPKTTERLIDIADLKRFSVPVYSEMTVVGEAQIEVLDKVYDTVLVKEKNKAPLLEWTFTNQYWIDRVTGHIVQSKEYTTPETPVLWRGIGKVFGE